MEELLQQILQECRPYTGQGALASYIPELARQDPDRLGIAVFDRDGNMVEAGDSRRSFTIQSVMKPLLLLLALQDNGRETVRAHVGVEATGKPFDAINVADNALLAKHLNPMVNAGAILMCQLVGGETYDQRFARLLGFIRRLAANEKIDLDEEVYHSEKATGSKNRALAYLLKAHGLIHGDVEELLDCYFRACSIRVSAADLARIGCVLACHGQLPDGQRLNNPLFDLIQAVMIAIQYTAGGRQVQAVLGQRIPRQGQTGIQIVAGHRGFVRPIGHFRQLGTLLEQLVAGFLREL